MENPNYSKSNDQSQNMGITQFADNFVHQLEVGTKSPNYSYNTGKKFPLDKASESYTALLKKEETPNFIIKD